MLLSELEPGQNAIVDSVGGSDAIRRHLLDMGLTPNALITLQKVAPMGDPIQITVRRFELTLRLEEANNVQVTLSRTSQQPFIKANTSTKTSPTSA